jgi:hypothetical protein
LNSNRRNGFVILSAALLAMGALSAAPAAAADAPAGGKSDDWAHAFNGHEMWLTSIDEARERAVKEKKPLLADFYSFT